MMKASECCSILHHNSTDVHVQLLNVLHVQPRLQQVHTGCEGRRKEEDQTVSSSRSPLVDHFIHGGFLVSRACDDVFVVRGDVAAQHG